MNNNRSRSLWVNNGLLMLALLAFSAAVFFDVSIQFRSLSSMTFGLICFPIVFVLINIHTLNQKYPLDARRRKEEMTARRGGADRDFP